MTTVTTIEELKDYIAKTFVVRRLTPDSAEPLNMYFFEAAAQEGRDVAATLVDRMKHEFDMLKSMGATDIVFGSQPAVIEENGRVAIGALFVAKTGSNTPLFTGYEVKDEPEFTLVDQAEKPKPAAPTSGYDLVEDKEDAVLLCAKIIHEAVKAINDAWNEHTLSWETNRDSVVAGVKRMLGNPGETPEANHQAWMDYKLKEGWVYGATKDAAAKTHPCLVPYEVLGAHAKSKDLIFQAIVRTFFGL